MIIGILQAGYVPKSLVARHGQYPAMFANMLAGHGFELQTFLVAEMDFPESVSACDGWLITGSAHAAYETHAYLPRLEEFIRAAVAAEVPLVGICFGHQIMAQALGGKIEKFAGGWGVGLQRYRMGTEEHAWFAMHQDQVVQKPPTADVIASADYCAHAGLAYRGKHGVTAISFQPHPEFSAEFTRDLIELRAGKELTTEQSAEALVSLNCADDSAWLAQQIAKFYLREGDQ